MRSWLTAVLTLVAAMLLAAVPPVTASNARAAGQVLTFGDQRIVTLKDANQVLEGTPKSFRTYVVRQLNRERAVCGGATGSLGVAGFHTRGFAVGDIQVDECNGFGVVWKKAKAGWKRVTYLQDSPRCAVLRKAGVPRVLMRRTGWKYCYNASGVRVLY